MKTFTKTVTLAIVLVFAGAINDLKAQKFSNAGEYLEFIGTEYEDIIKDMWQYTSSVARDKNARKVESRRKELLNTLSNAQKKIARMPDFEGNGAYRDSVVSYLKLNYYILNDDYQKIMDLEEIAEQSYDNMEAYLRAQEEASRRLGEASKMLDKELDIFAETYKITLVEGRNKKAEKLANANKMYKYYNQVYLVFFKCFVQEAYLLEAMEQTDVNSMEQNKNSLQTYADEGMKELTKIGSYEGDNSLVLAAREMMRFYKNETEKDLPKLTDFYLKKENFEKIKTAFDSKSKSKRTQEDIDQYNKAGNEYNEAINAFNSTNERLNKDRNDAINNWNKSAKKFTSKHVRM